MATCRSVINASLRKIGVLGGGRDARTADATDVLAALEGLYTSWLSSGAGGRLVDVTPSTATTYVARGNERIWRQDATTLSVTLPELVSYDASPDYGHERIGYYGTKVTVETMGNDTIVTVETGQPIGYAITPRDAAAVVISDAVGGQTLAWLYDGHIKRWERIDQLQLDDEAPRSSADHEGLSALLAMEIADQYGQAVGPTTQRQAARYMTALTVRYGMRREENYQPGAYF